MSRKTHPLDTKVVTRALAILFPIYCLGLGVMGLNYFVLGVFVCCLMPLVTAGACFKEVRIVLSYLKLLPRKYCIKKSSSPAAWVVVIVVIVELLLTGYLVARHEAELKRLIAYEQMAVNAPFADGQLKFHGFSFHLNNVGTDTISDRLNFMYVNIDGVRFLTSTESRVAIIPQTQGIPVEAHLPLDVLIPPDAKIITVEFEMDYDTIPSTGIRRSYRKYAFPINWANGRNNPPLLELQPVAESEQ